MLASARGRVAPIKSLWVALLMLAPLSGPRQVVLLCNVSLGLLLLTILPLASSRVISSGQVLPRGSPKRDDRLSSHSKGCPKPASQVVGADWCVCSTEPRTSISEGQATGLPRFCVPLPHSPMEKPFSPGGALMPVPRHLRYASLRVQSRTNNAARSSSLETAAFRAQYYGRKSDDAEVGTPGSQVL